MTERANSSEAQSQYLALINALVESHHNFDKLQAPADARDRLLDVIGRCRDDYNARFQSSAGLPTKASVD